MFGYQEEKYEVTKSKTINLKNMKQIIEVRKPEEDNEERKAQLKAYLKRGGICEYNDKSPYISLIGMDSEGNVILDYLFYYDFESSTKGKTTKTEDEKQVLLEEDLAMLINTNKIINIEDLNAYRRINDHHIGYTKCGSVTMY